MLWLAVIGKINLSGTGGSVNELVVKSKLYFILLV